MFSRVSTGRISEVIVEQVRQLMREGQLKAAAARLPPPPARPADGLQHRRSRVAGAAA
jgi:hypothetical protein